MFKILIQYKDKNNYSKNKIKAKFKILIVVLNSISYKKIHKKFRVISKQEIILNNSKVHKKLIYKMTKKVFKLVSSY